MFLPFITCKHCSKIFNDYSNFHIHLIKEHDSLGLGDPPITCEYCPKTFYNIPIYEKHLETFHEVLTNFECKICHEMYLGNDEFDKHLQYTHGTNNWSLNLALKDAGRPLENDSYYQKLKNSKFCMICGSEVWTSYEKHRGDNIENSVIYGACKKHTEEVKKMLSKNSDESLKQ